jgi:hypothetical protein
MRRRLFYKGKIIKYIAEPNPHIYVFYQLKQGTGPRRKGWNRKNRK